MQVRMICPLSRMAKLGQDTSTRPKSASSGTNAGRKGVSKPPAPRFRHLHDLFERVQPPPRPKFAARSRRSFFVSSYDVVFTMACVCVCLRRRHRSEALCAGSSSRASGSRVTAGRAEALYLEDTFRKQTRRRGFGFCASPRA